MSIFSSGLRMSISIVNTSLYVEYLIVSSLLYLYLASNSSVPSGIVISILLAVLTFSPIFFALTIYSIFSPSLTVCFCPCFAFCSISNSIFSP